jgi:hypothetical protein
MTNNVFKIYKEISAIPTPYIPNAVYAIRVGLGYDLYIANSTGTTVFLINVPNLNIVSISPTGTVNGQQWILETDTIGEIEYNQLGLMITKSEKKYELCISINNTIKKSLLI